MTIFALLFLGLIQLVILAILVYAWLALFKLAPNLNPPWTLLTIHLLLVALTVAPSFFGKGGGEPPFDDIYFPFFVYPGPLVHFSEQSLASLAWPWLNQHVGYREGSYACIVSIPALLTAAFGGLFWFLVGYFVLRKHCATHFGLKQLS